MSNIAYSERDIKAIGKREKLNFLYKGFRKVFKFLTRHNNTQVKNIATYPAISDKFKLIEIANKLAWAFPKKNGLNIKILVDKPLLGFELNNVKEIPYQRNYLITDMSHIELVSKVNDFDLILFIDAKALLKKPWWVHKSEIIDKCYFSTTEGGFLQYGFSQTLSTKEINNLKQLGKTNFEQMIEQNKHKSKSYCFVTGPSFDRYNEFEFEPDAFKVICNSTVKNDEFLEYIGGPDILTFADPVFHFSPSEYSAVFRDEVLKVYRKYKPYIIVPFNAVALLLAHYPELEERIIGMDAKKDVFNFPTSERLWVRGSANILTLYMLPVASAVCDEVFVIGADGRNPDEKYFWKHSSSAQFDDLMNTVFETHPSFFRDRDYKDYYEEHCEFLEKLLQYGEAKGKTYYSLTNSYIPAFKKRMVQK